MMEKLLKQCLSVALNHRASDIHFTTKDNQLSVSLRIDSKMVPVKTKDVDVRFFRFLQYKANLDVSNFIAPQTGRFEMEVSGKKLSLRFAVLNTSTISSGVLRILNSHVSLTINKLTFDKDVIAYLNTIKHHRSGLFIMSGPTGSGKTTTLYTLLNDCQGMKVFTLEDPIEVYCDSYVQLQINEKQHLGYDEGIKQLLRHDPDVIMIGEIRDSEAAKMAVRCALTGHLVITSLHASSCISAIERLLELNVNKHQLFDVLQGVSNQRLYRVKDSIDKTGVYEVMKRKEIVHYFKEQTMPNEFQFLQDKVKEAVTANIIFQEEARQDLF